MSTLTHISCEGQSGPKNALSGLIQLHYKSNASDVKSITKPAAPGRKRKLGVLTILCARSPLFYSVPVWFPSNY